MNNKYIYVHCLRLNEREKKKRKKRNVMYTY